MRLLVTIMDIYELSAYLRKYDVRQTEGNTFV